MIELNKIEIRCIDIRELKLLEEFQDKYYPKLRIFDVLFWQYFNNYLFEGIIVIIKACDKIIGSEGIIPYELIYRNKEMISGKSEATLLAEELRGKGYLRKIYNLVDIECINKKINILWGFTKAIEPLRKIGYVNLGKTISQSILPLDNDSFSDFLLGKYGIKNIVTKNTIKGITKIYKLLFTITFRNKLKNNYILILNQKNPSDIEMLYVTLFPQQNAIYIKPSIEFYKWMTNNNPIRKYEIRYVYKNNQLVGYIVWCMEELGVRICDFLFTNEEVANMLFLELSQRIKNLKMPLIIYSGNHNNSINKTVFDFLKKQGFLKVKRKNYFVVKYYENNDTDFVFNSSNWYINDFWSENI